MIHKSHVEMWITCPRKYYLSIVKKIAWIPTVPMEVGGRFHEFAANFFRKLDWEELRYLVTYDEVMSLFKEQIPVEIPVLVKPLCDNFIDFEARRWCHLLQMYEDPITIFKPIAVEKFFEVPEVNMAGTVDRIDQTSKNTLCVIEYKTGRIYKPAVRRELAFYALMIDASKLYTVPVTHIGWYNPRFNQASAEPLTRRLLNATRRRLLQFQRSNETKFFPKRESANCLFCPVMTHCLEGGDSDESNIKDGS